MTSEEFTIISLVLTSLSLIVSIILVINYIDLRKKQTDPMIAIYYYPTDSWNVVKDLVIKNIGGGPAYHITFNIKSDFDSEDDKLMNKNVIKNGIKYLAPGCKYQFFLVNLYTDFALKTRKPLSISVEYYNYADKSILKIWRRSYRNDFLIDLSELGNTPMIDKQEKTMTDLVNQLVKMNSTITSLVRESIK